MKDARWAPRRLGDLHDVEAESIGFDPQPSQVGQRRAPQHLLFSAVDGEVAGDQGRIYPGLDLNEHDDLPVAANQINLFAFITGISPVPGHDLQAPPREKISRGILAGGTR